MQENELETLELMRSFWADVFDPAIEIHSGEIAKKLGDGALVVFPSAVEAVKCALAIQLGMIARYPVTDFRLRIGINIGDIIVENNDFFGDGVNIAARLEGLSPAGGIAISQLVQGEINGKVPFEFDCIGRQELKNILKPVEVWTWSPATSQDEGRQTLLIHKPGASVQEISIGASTKPDRRDGVFGGALSSLFLLTLVAFFVVALVSLVFVDVQKLIFGPAKNYAYDYHLIEEFRDCDDCPQMVSVAGPRYGHLLSRGSKPVAGDVLKFSISKYEVTNSEYVFFLNNSDQKFSDDWLKLNSEFKSSKIALEGDTFKVLSGFEQYPVTHVSWLGATAYTGWLSSFTRRKYRLPNKEEWEFAHKAGTTSQFFFGDGILRACEYSNIPDWELGDVESDRRVLKCRDGAVGVTSVGQYKPNPFNLYDTMGNVREWTLDCFEGETKSCDNRIFVGGSFSKIRWDDTGLLDYYSLITHATEDLGFRVLAESK